MDTQDTGRGQTKENQQDEQHGLQQNPGVNPDALYRILKVSCSCS